MIINLNAFYAPLGVALPYQKIQKVTRGHIPITHFLIRHYLIVSSTSWKMRKMATFALMNITKLLTSQN